MLISPEHHLSQPWLVRQLAEDLDIEDVWRFPIQPGTEGQFPVFCEAFGMAVKELNRRGPAGFLFKLREFLGRIFGWDGAQKAPDPNEITPGSLRERMKDRGLGDPPPLGPEEVAFKTVYLNDREHLSEISNKTVHAALHLSWYPDPNGDYRAEMAVYVKARGWFGKSYMQAIKPFRHWIVYPAIMKTTARIWADLTKGGPSCA